MSDRKLAAVETILDIQPIPDANDIEVATVRGWQVVVKKNEFIIGQKCIFFEVDSFIPNDLAPFLTQKDRFPKEYMGIKGERLRTCKFRGQLSQGLVLDPHKIFSHDYAHTVEVGADVTEQLNIKLWEAPIAACLAGQVKGTLPSFLAKTDAERVQNLLGYFEKYREIDFEASLKIDGTSFTAYLNNSKFGVCSRNLELEEDENNTYWKVARELDIENKLRILGRNISIQGEIAGESIQKNPDKLKGHNLFIFNVYDIDNRRYLLPIERRELVEQLDLIHVPIISESMYPLKMTLEELLNFSNGRSINSDVREGIVYKSNIYINNVILMFKVINNFYLLSTD